MKSYYYLILLVTLSIISCKNNNTDSHDYYEEERKKIEIAHQERLKQYADSTVSLSFKGIKLGSPFQKNIIESIKNKSIYKVKYNKDKTSATCKAIINTPNRENGVEVDVKIVSYQDTITSFIIISTVYDTYKEIETLYKDKYKEEYASIENDEEYWGDKIERSCNRSLVWNFKNQSIRFTEFDTEKRENYIKNAKMHSPENRYGVKYTKYFKAITIIYNDIYHCKKAEEYENTLKKIEEDKIRKAEIEDSIKTIKRNEELKKQDI